MASEGSSRHHFYKWNLTSFSSKLHIHVYKITLYLRETSATFWCEVTNFRWFWTCLLLFIQLSLKSLTSSSMIFRDHCLLCILHYMFPCSLSEFYPELMKSSQYLDSGITKNFFFLIAPKIKCFNLWEFWICYTLLKINLRFCSMGSKKESHSLVSYSNIWFG